MTAFQASLLDTGAEVGFGPLGLTVRRIELTEGAWLDVRPRWVEAADTLFDRLHDGVAWRAERRPMYDRVVDVPRLLHFVGEGVALPDSALTTARDALDAHYADELGERFVTAGLCLYRDGRDSVAWHGDRIGRGGTHDTMVAIIVLGAPRAFAVRPSGGGPAQRFEFGHGDLVVMGGSCQRTYEHCIPKVAGHVGPRISVQFRTRGVR